MSFNAGNFIKSTAKSVVNRLVDDIVNKAISGLPQNSKLLASSTAEALLKTGSSFKNIEAFSANRTKEVASNSADEFYVLAGKSTSRVAAGSLSKLRRAGQDKDVQGFLQNINPATKINSKKDDLEVLSVI
jgi:hypothetical protein